MTPFNPEVLGVMLTTFYADVGSASLARARRERPEYFAAGTLGGADGSTLTLPDGRVFELLRAADVAGGTARWSVARALDRGVQDDPTFPLEPGPLTPIDALPWSPAPADREFERIAAGPLHELGIAGGQFEWVQGYVATLMSPDQAQAAMGGELDEAHVALGEEWHAAGASIPDDVLAGTVGRNGVIDAFERDTDYTAPPFMAVIEPGVPPEPGPGERPEPGEPRIPSA